MPVYDYNDGVRHIRILAKDDDDFALKLKAILDKEEELAQLRSWVNSQKPKWIKAEKGGLNE